ncbi:MAG: hypothetical protein WCP16_10825 [Pseudanabaena sp. ELA645]
MKKYQFHLTDYMLFCRLQYLLTISNSTALAIAYQFLNFAIASTVSRDF